MRLAAIALALFACCTLVVTGCAHSSKSADTSATATCDPASCEKSCAEKCAMSKEQCAEMKTQCTAEQKAACSGAKAATPE